MDNLDLNQMLAKLAKMDKNELEKNLKIAQENLIDIDVFFENS